MVCMTSYLETDLLLLLTGGILRTELDCNLFSHFVCMVVFLLEIIRLARDFAISKLV